MKIIKISLFIYFSLLFKGHLMAQDDKKKFLDAAGNLRNQLSEYIYSASSLNPFKTNIFDAKKAKKFKEFLDDPLRSDHLADYKLIGLVWETKIPKAIVQDTTGKTHVLRKGDYLGNRQGQIIAIREGELVILELEEEYGPDNAQEIKKYQTKILTFSELFIKKKNKNNTEEK